MSTTQTHLLQLIAGHLRIDITEAPDMVHLGISGARPRGFERRKVRDFLWPLVDAFRDDPRSVCIVGQGHVEGRVDPIGAGCWVAYETRPEALQ